MEKYFNAVTASIYLLYALVPLITIIALKIMQNRGASKEEMEKFKNKAENVEAAIGMTQKAVQLCELMYLEKKNYGKVKKEEVMAFVKKHGILKVLTEEQVSNIVDATVTMYNMNNWEGTLVKPVEQ